MPPVDLAGRQRPKWRTNFWALRRNCRCLSFGGSRVGLICLHKLLPSILPSLCPAKLSLIRKRSWRLGKLQAGHMMREIQLVSWVNYPTPVLYPTRRNQACRGRSTPSTSPRRPAPGSSSLKASSIIELAEIWATLCCIVVLEGSHSTSVLLLQITPDSVQTM